MVELLNGAHGGRTERSPEAGFEPTGLLQSPTPGAPTATSRVAGAKALSIVLDLGAASLAMVMAYLLSTGPGGVDADAGPHAALGAITLPVWVFLFATHDLYSYRGVANRIDEWRRIVRAVTAATVGAAGISFLAHIPVSRGWLCLVGVCALGTVGAERSALRGWYAHRRRHGKLARRTIVVGGNAEARALVDALESHPELGQHVVGVVADVDHGEFGANGPPRLGSVDAVLQAAETAGASGVLFASTALSHDRLNHHARALLAAGIHVEISTGLCDIAPGRLRARSAGRFPVTYIEPLGHQGWRAAAKRSFDVVLSALLVVLTLPVLAAAAILIKLDSRGPILFRQRRVGLHGEPFTIYKLRTMTVDAEDRLIDLREQNEADGPLFKLTADPRVTRIGRLLRKSSVDELPQLLNVLRNQMSLVGPRPAIPSEVSAWSPELHNRLRVKPGITGMWQTSGRSQTTFDEYVRLDLFYVDNWSLLTDLRIILKTVPAVVLSRGAC